MWRQGRRSRATLATMAPLIVGCVALVARLSGCAPAEQVVPHKPVHLRFATGPVGGGFYAFGEALTASLIEHNAALKIERPVSTGVVSNLEAVQRGTADIGFGFADIAYLAANGRLRTDTPPFHHLRAIAVVQLTPVQLLASARSGVRSVRDLRGRNIAVGPEGSGTAMTARLVLEAFGVGKAHFHEYSLDFQVASRRVAEGSIDAMFDNAQYAEAIALGLRRGARLVPIDGPEIARLREDYPFLRRMTLPANTYSGTAAISTVGVESLLICRDDLDEQIVHDLTADLFAALTTLSRSGRWNLVDLMDSPATSLRLHDGAARYYREQELTR